jgi:hypothetical protein
MSCEFRRIVRLALLAALGAVVPASAVQVGTVRFGLPPALRVGAAPAVLSAGGPSAVAGVPALSPAALVTPPLAAAAPAVVVRPAAAATSAAAPSAVDSLRGTAAAAGSGSRGSALPTLDSLFEGRKIRSVFNGDAGDGSWQRDIAGEPWLEKDASVVGFDKPAPSQYGFGPTVTPGKDWSGIKVVTNEAVEKSSF